MSDIMTVRCKRCGTKIKVKKGTDLKKIKCPVCDGDITVKRLMKMFGMK